MERSSDIHVKEERNVRTLMFLSFELTKSTFDARFYFWETFQSSSLLAGTPVHGLLGDCTLRFFCFPLTRPGFTWMISHWYTEVHSLLILFIELRSALVPWLLADNVRAAPSGDTPCYGPSGVRDLTFIKWYLAMGYSFRQHLKHSDEEGHNPQQNT